ncbi:MULTISPECIES: hypothetical protein [Enterobacter cloacae complex]|uniref:hypothetical protein n=1 Tax=Enterobacter cloacae complex TaxID=354276 RepID=UPI00044D6344|nr:MULTISPECIES: hypothetical protein [Enterobacter cloacae complex]EUM27077.1 hypothetical protein L462_02730 [Enterobacter sp. BIDMC 26]MDO0900983.1 hypothetical protein [Enterobacter hormaechei]MEB7374737.1 hypothetical protein [Enterobacter hormaechei]
MIKPSVNNLTCSWTDDPFCKIGTLFHDENQYVTWVLVLIGWVIAFAIARYQIFQDKNKTKDINHNEWIGEFREKLESLEDFGLYFWAEKNTNNEALAFAKMVREIKSLTTLAKEIKSCGSIPYQPKLFKDLRQALTDDSNVKNRPLPPNDFQIRRIRETCSSLRQVYSRKN